MLKYLASIIAVSMLTLGAAQAQDKLPDDSFDVHPEVESDPQTGTAAHTGGNTLIMDMDDGNDSQWQWDGTEDRYDRSETLNQRMFVQEIPASGEYPKHWHYQIEQQFINGWGGTYWAEVDAGSFFESSDS